MTIEIKVPELPESVSDATVAEWQKSVGDTVSRDEKLVDLETDKIMLDVPAPERGVIKAIKYEPGAVVEPGQVLAIIDETQTASQSEEKSTPDESSRQSSEYEESTEAVSSSQDSEEGAISPSIRRLMKEHGLEPAQIQGSGKKGRVLKEDVERAVAQQDSKAEPQTTKQPRASEVDNQQQGRIEERVPMSRMRTRIAERLLDVTQNTAMLTTFNEVNMQPVMDLRTRYKASFQQAHDVKLGFMSFFVKAAVEALKQFPAINASIDGTDVIYHGYFDLGIAVSTDKGLVVPVLRDVDQLSMADIEKQIIDFGKRASKGQLGLDEMKGGTFSITNGGIFGSMLSTPIINPPQCAIMGMHNIVKRPVVENDQIVIRPMMYLALSYDHRLVDGKEAVTFLVKIKELIEDPARMLLNL